MQKRIPWSRILAGAAIGLILIIGGAAHYLHSGKGAAALANFVSGSASSPGMKVDVGSIDDVLTSNPVVRNVAVADAEGTWLKIDQVSLRWSRFALLRLVLDIDSLDIGRIDVLRRPVPAAAPAQEKRPETTRSAFRPNLPVKVRLGRLSVAQIALAQPLLDRAATLALRGTADLGGASDAARLELSVQRADAPGEIAANVAFDPSDGRLSVNVAATEPEGGLIARLAKIPGLPPIEISLNGAGALDAFDARLTAKAGAALSAEGGAQIQREGASRRVALQLSAQFAELLPKNIATLFAGATNAQGLAHIDDDGGARLERLALRTSAFALDASGALDARQNISAHLALHGRPAAEGAAFSARTLEGEANVAGALARPEATLKLLVEDAEGPFGRLGHIDLDARAVTDGDLANPASRLDVSAEGRATSLALADAALAEALGETTKLSLRARVSGGGDAEIGLAKIETGTAEASFTGRAGPAALDGRAMVSAPSLGRFAQLAGRSLRGALTLRADISGAPQEGRIEAKLNGGILSPGFGVPTLDGLLGGRLALSGKLDALPEGGFAFDQLALRGDHIDALVDGAATRESAKLNAKITLPDLRRADERLTGRADVEAKLTGSLAKPSARLDATILEASVNGRPIPKLALSGEAENLTGDVAAIATLDGVVDGKSARGRVSAARAGAGWKIDTVDLAVGSASVKGAVALDAAGLANGRLAVSAPDLNDLSALALQTLAGRLSADIALDPAAGGQNVELGIRGGGLRAGSAAIEQFAVKFSGRDIYRRPLFDGEAAIDAAQVGKEVVSRLRLRAKPAGGDATALDLSLDAHGFNVASRATFTQGERARLDLTQFSAQRGDKRIALAGPAVVTLKEGVVDFKDLSLALGSGRLDIDGSAGERLDLTAKARALPLAMAALADPRLALEGALDAEARITGPKAAPTGDWKVKVTKATAPQLRVNGLPAVDAAARGRLAGSRTTVDADIGLGPASRLKLSGSAPLGAGALELAIKGVVDAALANTMLAANGQTVAGKANVDLRVAGATASPLIGGSITLTEGAFTDPLNGVSLSKIGGRIEGQGREINIASLTGQTKNGGQIAVSGRVTVDPDAGLPGSIHIGAHQAQLANTDIVSSTGDLDLTVSGPLARAPKVSGRIVLANMDVSVPDRIPANLKPLAGTSHINARGFAAQMLALEREAKAKAARRSNFDMALDLTLSAPSRIFVRGRGIDAEFGGDLKILGSIQKPNVIGGFDLRRGKLQLLTQRIDITRGKLTFAGGLAPELDFSAETTASDVTAKIGVAGPAALPTFSFTSSPDLPQDEVLSRLLFAKASGSLTPFQAVQLATALAQFSGSASGVDAFEKMRKSLGVDQLDLDAGGANGPSIGASRYIMDGVNVGVKTGAKPEQSAVSVGVDIMKGVRAQGETRADGKTSVGIGVDWDY
jgi:translocation and assembly module TamB